MIHYTVLLLFWLRPERRWRWRKNDRNLGLREETLRVALRVLGATGAVIASLAGDLSGTAAQGAVPLTDSNPLEVPQAGRHGLRVLSPTLLELTQITTKAADPARVSAWDFVDLNFQLRAPDPGEFAVTVDGQPFGVQRVGFKRRPIYAPLRSRDLRIGSHLYLELNRPVAEGQSVVVTNPGERLWSSAATFVATADPLRLSPAIHVNQVGYAPAAPKKAMIGYYLGSLGEMPPPPQLVFQLLDEFGATAFQGFLARRIDQGFTYSPAPYQQVWEADFTALTQPGRYRLSVPGLGVSYPFLIDEGVPAAFARAYALGLYHQRCGASEQLPYTRHVHDACHRGLAEVPDWTFDTVNRELASMTTDFTWFQIAPQLKDTDSSLYPFLNSGPCDVSGGHHDAGDYSKYTINSAGLIHFLVFAADAFPGVAALDNLGLPESGDGKSDILQEAKWEADFLAKMQDFDGGFYFLVYPRDREYEDDVLPDRGDPQVVFPKTTAVTAAAVAALAEAGSSPTFRQQFPAEAAVYLQKAQLGWSFLQNTITKHGKDGAYQKITHYGNEFGHDDELAWAASALFVATGDEMYHQQLRAWFDPSDPRTRRWTWWRLFEGYGCAVRTYAFAARTGRLPAAALDPAYLAKCEAEILAAADDQARFARQSAYGTSFPEPNKAQRSAGWYFSSERAFDLTVAYQVTQRLEYAEAVFSNLNYESGCNPVNVSYITGLGSRRQREIVHQYAQNDRRVLPPSGLPLGNVQAGFQYLDSYLSELEAITYPPDGSDLAPYPFYDRWGDSFNTTTEFVIMDQARSLASLAYWMAQTPVAQQAWTFADGQITGLPAEIAAEEPVMATLVVPGLDLTHASIVWEARDQEPQFGNPVTFSPKHVGEQWVEVEAQLPDGRRVFATATFVATTAPNTAANLFQPAALTVSSDMIALYHLDEDATDAAGYQSALQLQGNTRLSDVNLGWLTDRHGRALHFQGPGDKAVLTLPADMLRSGTDTTAIIVEAMVYVDAFTAYKHDLAAILSLSESWNAFLQLGEDLYAGPYVRGGTQLEWMGGDLAAALTPLQWHHLALELNQGGYVVRVDGNAVAGAPSDELANWGRSPSARLELGNFSGWIDEVVVRSVHSGLPPNSPPNVNLLSPAHGANFTAPAQVILTATGGDVDGAITRVEFYDGAVKLGEVASGAYPYTFVWNGVPVGTYTITAKAFDDLGGSAVSKPATIVISTPEATAAAPSFTPNGGGFLNSTIVTVTTATPGATIRYTTDGTLPTISSPVYFEPLQLSSSATVQARAFKAGLADSPVASAHFSVTAVGASGARATFLEADSGTQGNWKSICGLEGYYVIGDASFLPPYVQASAAGKSDFNWTESGEDYRELQKASGPGRVAGIWYSSTSFVLNLAFTDGKTHRLSLYLLDWDRAGRAQTIEVLDAANNAVLDTQTVTSMGNGKYLVWDLKGRIKLRFTRLSGPNTVLSGLFFDPSAHQTDTLAVAPLLSSPGINRAIATDGFKLHVSGEASGSFVLEASRDLREWEAISTNTLAGSEADLIDLRAKDAPSRFYRVRNSAPAVGLKTAGNSSE